MAEPLVSDEFWGVLEPMIPKHKPSPKGGRPRIDNRKALTGILFVLKSGIPWEMLPPKMGRGCRVGVACRNGNRQGEQKGLLSQNIAQRARTCRNKLPIHVQSDRIFVPCSIKLVCPRFSPSFNFRKLTSIVLRKRPLAVEHPADGSVPHKHDIGRHTKQPRNEGHQRQLYQHR